MGVRVAAGERVESRGYGRNTEHWRLELDDGRRAFAKVALDDMSVGWLRAEHRIYAAVAAPFLAELIAWHDAEATVLVIEDLSDAYWPPPWQPGQVETVLAALEEVRATPPPDGVPRLEDARWQLAGWREVAADPQPLLATGLCSSAWLERALPVLLDAVRTCRLDGDELLHLDVRSDNLCFRDGRAVLVDWNLAHVGNALLDVVAWLPSLRLEGGPAPEEIVASSGGLSALLAGFFASRAGLPPPPTAPTVRAFQRAQAEVALAWAACELGLPPPDRS